MIEGRIVEIETEEPLKSDNNIKRDIENENRTDKVSQEMEALAENEELIQDWLDDKM